MKRILVIDDFPDNVFLLQDRLEREGYEVIKAYNGEMGIQKAIEEKPDLILLDVMMPDISGFDVCKKLSTTDGTNLIPIILLTALTEVEDIKTAISETATYIINSCNPQHCSSFDVTFKMEAEKLFVDILIPTACSDFLESQDNMSLIMIKGCMNEFKVDKDKLNNVTNIHLMKLKG